MCVCVCVYFVCVSHIVHTDTHKQVPYATCRYPIICQNENDLISFHAGVTRVTEVEIEIDAADCSTSE